MQREEITSDRPWRASAPCLSSRLDLKFWMFWAAECFLASEMNCRTSSSVTLSWFHNCFCSNCFLFRCSFLPPSIKTRVTAAVKRWASWTRLGEMFSIWQNLNRTALSLRNPFCLHRGLDRQPDQPGGHQVSLDRQVKTWWNKFDEISGNIWVSENGSYLLPDAGRSTTTQFLTGWSTGPSWRPSSWDLVIFHF